MNYFIGIDNGGTLIKAVLFDALGNEISQASEGVGVLTPKAGFTERNMDDLFLANCRCIRKALEQSTVSADEITAVCCAGHGKGLYLWGKDGRPAYNGIVSTDARAWEYPLIWKKSGVSDRVFNKTYQTILASQPVSILRWLQDNEPEVIDNIKWIFSVKDYIRFRLTGEAYGEITDFSGNNLVNLNAASYDKELLLAFGLDERLFECLPPLRYSTDLCGVISDETARMTGLKAGTPVAGGMFDIDACAVAMDVTDESNLCVIAGTWSINEYISKEPVKNKSVMMNSLFCLPGYYLIEECSPTSAGNNEWFTKVFLGELSDTAKKRNISVYKLADELAEKVAPDEQNIVFLPYLYGSNYNPRAKACMIGLDSSHSLSHVIRAVLEGIAFCHMEHIDKLLANRPVPDVVRLAGGAAKSPLWVQIFADVLDLPIEIVDTKELGALGCAMCAAVSSGVYEDLKEAAKHMVHLKGRIMPISENVMVYKRKRKYYQTIAEALEPVWE